MKGSCSFSVYSIQFCAVIFLTPPPLLKRMSKFAQKPNGIRDMPFSKGSPQDSSRYLYKVFVCDPWQSLLASENTVCAWYYLKSRCSTAAVAALLCILLGAGEPGDPVCGTNPVPQVFKQACCQFSSAAIPVWPECLWIKSSTSSQFLPFFPSEGPLFTWLSTYVVSQTEHQWGRSVLLALYHENPKFTDSSWLQILHSVRSRSEFLCLVLNNESLDDPKPHQG